MPKKKKTQAEVASVTLDLVDLILIEEVEEGVELSAEQNPLLNEFRSLAKIQFVLCHSLPAVNSNGATWTYPTLLNSYKTVRHQVVNLNHELKDNQKVLKIRVGNNIIGHMVDADIQELEVTENGEYPLVPSKPVPVIATAYLYKRVVPELIAKLKRGEKVKVSMECEFTDMGFLYEGEMFTRMEKPEFAGKREFNGKPIVRVLGGIDPKGGVVNFWGCAILDNQKPADENAEVLSAVATEIGEDPSDFINLVNEEEIEMNNFLQRLPEEVASLLRPLLEVKDIKEITDENIAQALLDQADKIKELETKIEGLLNNKSEHPQEEEVSQEEETTPETQEEAAIPGSLEEHVDLIKQNFKKKLMMSGKCEENALIRGILPNSVIIEEWKEDEGYECFQIQYAYTEGNELLFGAKKKINIRYVEVLEPAMDDEDEEDEEYSNASDTNPQGEAENMPKNKKEVAQQAEEITNPPVDSATAGDEAPADNESNDGVEETNEEVASLKSRIEALVLENKELKDQVNAFQKEKAEAARQVVLNNRKNALAEDFDLDDLLDEDEENVLAQMSDEEFNAYAAKLKKIAAKSKKGKQIDPGDGKMDPVGGGPQKQSPNGGQIDLETTDDVIGPGNNKKQEKQHKTIKGVASEAEDNKGESEVSNNRKPVMPFSPEMPVNKDLKNKFGRF